MIVGNDHFGQELSQERRGRDLHADPSVPALQPVIPRRQMDRDRQEMCLPERQPGVGVGDEGDSRRETEDIDG